MKKKIYTGYAYKDDHATYFDKKFTKCKEELENICQDDVNKGIDGILITDFSDDDQAHDNFMGLMRKCARVCECPIITGGRVHRLEDVKKYLYAGADIVYLDMSEKSNKNMISEAAERFGKEKIYAYLSEEKQLSKISKYLEAGVSGLIIDTDHLDPHSHNISNCNCKNIICTSHKSYNSIADTLTIDYISGDVIMSVPDMNMNYTELKHKLSDAGFDVSLLIPSCSWSDIKTDSNGLMPVIVQDYRTDEILMLAYMDEEAWNCTMRTERMHYYSRSRKKLWLKGETSGHFQYVKSLTLDCDNDTLLAKVFQIGAACHTGSRSCFFNSVAAKENFDKNPRKVLEDVYSVILDRKAHPKEGSYTNYLFDKGIDKILKKVGEEASEIIIAAKNPDPEEIKYEISDFLYHAMVLMAEKGVTWDDICKELANR